MKPGLENKDIMEAMIRIEQGCDDNNHETVMSVLNSIDSFNLKKQALLKIIEYYERKSMFPVGYVLLLIRWLLQNNDRPEAMEYILKCYRNGMDKDRISYLIYETVIKENEIYYKNKFNGNLQLLQQHNVLISNKVFDFEQIKKQVVIVANCLPPVPELLKKDLFNKDKTFLMVDIIDMEMLVEMLNALSFVYLVYSDVQQLYYMLLFEDYSVLSKYIEQKKIIFFDGMDEAPSKDFFMDLLVKVPDNVFGTVNIAKYNDLIKNISDLRYLKVLSSLEQMNAYYKDLDHKYYMELFTKDPSKIKIMLITSEITELNKFIAKNWHQAFLELGYQAKLLIENNPYEIVSNLSIYEMIHEFKPDIIFHINWTVNSVLPEGEIRKNILWIMRYRDSLNNPLNHTEPGHNYKYNNMFILPIFLEWSEKMKSIGIPENRILNISDGVNINLFSEKHEINKQYACDIVAVNNAGGSESSRLDYYFDLMGNMIGNKTGNEVFQKTVLEQFDKLKEAVNDEKNIFLTNVSETIIDSLIKELLIRGLKFNEYGKEFIGNFFEHILDTLCRGKIMEWIIDSGITTNIKLWGKGWANHKKFKKFHMGVARHGEELITIYRSSRISVSDTPWALHERSFEVFAGGGFPLIRHVKCPEIESPNKITNFFKENEEVVLFYSKDDLLNKIQYYLDNPDERDRIAEKGRQVVINNFSHIAIAGKTMDFIKEYYKE